MKTYGPYSTFKKTGNFIFTSGQIGAVDGIAPLGIEAQVKTALNNLETVLKLDGCDMSKVIKTTVYLKNIYDFEIMNKIYKNVFEKAGTSPARSTVEVSDLPHVANNPLLIEIEAIAEL